MKRPNIHIVKRIRLWHLVLPLKIKDLRQNSFHEIVNTA